MKIAFVYDRVNKFGGAEQVLLSLHALWPEAPLYTSVYNQATALWAHEFAIKTSFLNFIPLAKRHHELFPWLTPLAFESFNFDSFDVVISVTSAEAKTIITKPGTLHICYCLTPTRYLWSGYTTYQQYPGLGVLNGIAKPILKVGTDMLRSWDLIAASRPDEFIAISSIVKDRIEQYYHRPVAQIIHPPVNTEMFNIPKENSKSGDYYLVVSRLVGYKRIDILIEAFNVLNLPLVIIGDGHERFSLQRIAKKNITFIHKKLTEEKLAEYYQQCKAFVFAAEEDFGIVAAEAQACGKPVIAFKKSGISDIVIDRKTGILFTDQTQSAVIEAVKISQTMNFDSSQCRERAIQFSQESFRKKMRSFVEDRYIKKRL